MKLNKLTLGGKIAAVIVLLFALDILRGVPYNLVPKKTVQTQSAQAERENDGQTGREADAQEEAGQAETAQGEGMSAAGEMESEENPEPAQINEEAEFFHEYLDGLWTNKEMNCYCLFAQSDRAYGGGSEIPESNYYMDGDIESMLGIKGRETSASYFGLESIEKTDTQIELSLSNGVQAVLTGDGKNDTEIKMKTESMSDWCTMQKEECGDFASYEEFMSALPVTYYGTKCYQTDKPEGRHMYSTIDDTNKIITEEAEYCLLDVSEETPGDELIVKTPMSNDSFHTKFFLHVFGMKNGQVRFLFFHYYESDLGDSIHTVRYSREQKKLYNYWVGYAAAIYDAQTDRYINTDYLMDYEPIAFEEYICAEEVRFVPIGTDYETALQQSESEEDPVVIDNLDNYCRRYDTLTSSAVDTRLKIAISDLTEEECSLQLDVAEETIEFNGSRVRQGFRPDDYVYRCTGSNADGYVGYVTLVIHPDGSVFVTDTNGYDGEGTWR